MTNIIGQMLIVLAVNVTTNYAEFVKHTPESVELSNDIALVGTGMIWAATDETTNAPVSKQVETRIGICTPARRTNYMFSVWSHEIIAHGLPECWLATRLRWDTSGVGVNQ